MESPIRIFVSLVTASGLLLAALPVAALEPVVSHEPLSARQLKAPDRLRSPGELTAPAPDGVVWYETVPPWAMAARDTLEVEEHGGWTGEYIFGMSKAIMRSTLEPALKPAVLLLTVPLDLVLLPFAAIGGFFR